MFKLDQLGQRGKSILESEIETLIFLCLSDSSRNTPWIKLVMGGSPSETSDLVFHKLNNNIQIGLLLVMEFNN